MDNNDSELRGNFVRIARSIGTQATFIICRIELICLFCLFHVTVLFVSLVHVVLFEFFYLRGTNDFGVTLNCATVWDNI